MRKLFINVTKKHRQPSLIDTKQFSKTATLITPNLRIINYNILIKLYRIEILQFQTKRIIKILIVSSQCQQIYHSKRKIMTMKNKLIKCKILKTKLRF